ncbi:MAG: response regulator transcription factor [Phycisphaerae bacterium]|nr:response regulator transcription factor [Phycisphaerae bacterium]
MVTKILIADDHEILREGIISLIKEHADIQVVGEADNGLAAVEMTRKLRPDVVIMDVSMPGLDGIEATRQIKSELPEVKVLALSVHAKREFVLDMVRAGVSGYMLKECAFEDLINAIKTLAAGQSYLSPQVASIVLNGIAKDGFQFVDCDRVMFTLRESQVLRLLTGGESAKQIAAEVGLSVKTVEAIRRHIMEKAAVNNLADLTKFAVREGLTKI